MTLETEHTRPWEAAAMAKATYAALQDFQGFTSERRELHAAGVPSHTIDSLYPQTFANLAAGVLAHLRATGHKHIYHQRYLMYEMRDVGEEIMCGDDEQLMLAWEKDFPSKSRAGAAQLELEGFLYDAFGETSAALGVSDDFTLMLWNAWICMRHRSQLSPEKRIDADFLMEWVGVNLLPRLVNAAEGDQPKMAA